MKHGNIAKEAREHARPYCVSDGGKFRLKDFDPNDTGTLKSKEHAGGMLARGVELLSHLQEKLYAQDRWAVLLIFQAMNAAGKDAVIKPAMSGGNAQARRETSFKDLSK